jgi:hypothetical protein
MNVQHMFSSISDEEQISLEDARSEGWLVVRISSGCECFGKLGYWPTVNVLHFGF